MSNEVKIKVHFALLLFLLSSVLATGFSVDFYQSLYAQFSMVSGFFIYLFIFFCADSEKNLAISFIGIPIIALLMLFYVVPDTLHVRHFSPLNDVKKLDSLFLVVPNDVVMLAVLSPLIISAALTSGWLVKAVAIAYVLLAMIISVNMQSRQAVLLLLLGVVIVVGMMRPRWAILAFLAVLFSGFFIDWILGWPLSSKILMFPRTYVWHAGWMMFIDRPLTGQGPGLFKDLYFAYLAKAGYVLDALPDRRPMNWAHSLYFEQLAERGFLGLLSLIVLLATSIGFAAKVWKHSANQGVMRSLSAGLVAAVVVFAGAGVAETTFSRLWVIVLLLVLAGLSVALQRCADKKENLF